MSIHALIVHPVDSEFHPDQAQEEAAVGALLAAIDDPGDIDRRSYARAAAVEAGDKGPTGDRARFQVEVSGLDQPTTLTDAQLAAVSAAMGSPCRQVQVQWED